jgi:hypothetical protein
MQTKPRDELWLWDEAGGSGAWTRTRITSSKGWRATNCTTPELLFFLTFHALFSALGVRAGST